MNRRSRIAARALPLLLLLLLLPACGEDAAPPKPPLPPPGGAAAAVLPAAQAAEDAAGEPSTPRPPLPAKPADEAARLRGLVRLLEWGDTPLVEFAQERIASFPDRAAAARALDEKGTASLASNTGLVQNILGCVKDAEMGRALLPFLLRCLDGADPQVRRMAILQYAESAPEPDFALLGRFVLDSWHPVSQAALEGFRLHPGAKASAALREVIPSTREFTRAAALSTLGFLGDPASAPLLLAEMEASRRAGAAAWPVHVGAAQGLGRLGAEEGLAALRDIVNTLPLLRPPVPLDAPRESWDGPEVVLALAKDPFMQDRLVKQAREMDEGASAGAVRLLREYPASPETLGAFLAAVERSEWEPLLEGLDALRAAGSPDALPRTLAALSSPETDRRRAAALALGRFRDPASMKPLLDRFAVETDPSVAAKICDALGILGEPAAARALVAWMEGETAPSPEMALQAFYARQNLRGALGAAAAPDLVRMVASGTASAGVRFHAARALGQLPPSEAARGALTALLRSGNADLRAAAADALGESGDRAARDDIAQAAAREPDEVVAAAMRDDLLRIDLGSPVAESPR